MKSKVKAAVPENGEATAILISDVEGDHQFLKGLFKEKGWTLQAATTLDSALELLGDKYAPVVVTERELQSWSWKDVLKLTQVLPKPPLVIVISCLADRCLWAEALNLGAYDVLSKPL
jgi:two-component system response regulator PilR (NtrC family)